MDLALVEAGRHWSFGTQSATTLDYNGRARFSNSTSLIGSGVRTNSWRDIREKNFVAVGCDDPAIFHAIELTEVRGRGRHVQAMP